MFNLQNKEILSFWKLLKRSMVPQLLITITILTSGMIVNLVQCILYLGLRPVNKYAYRKINWYLCYTIYSQLVWLAEWWSGSNLIIYMDKNDYKKYIGKNHCLCFMNHTYEVDWLMTFMLSDRMHLLGNMKAFMKKSLQYIPVFGWVWKCSDCIMLDRSFEKDKEIITKQVAELTTYMDPIVVELWGSWEKYWASHSIYSKLLPELEWLTEWWSRSSLIIYMDKNDFEKYVGKNHCLYLMNHTYEIDWIIASTLTDIMHLLGNMKAFIKKSLQYIPVWGWGWGWKCSDIILLTRSFKTDKEVITKQVAELATYSDPIALLLFAEGTRFTPEKHKASEEFARMKNLPSLKYHLQPRTRGFITSVPSMREKVPDIFDIILAFKDDDPVKPTMMNLILGEPVTAYLYIKRIPMEDLPHSENELKTFCEDLYLRKDKLKDSFVKTGDFFATSGIPRTERLELSRRYYPLINMVFWAIVVLCPMVYYIALLLTGSTLQWSFGIGVIGIFISVSYIMLRVSEKSKGSSYGRKNGKSK